MADEDLVDTLYEGPTGHPFHEWIVTIGDSAEGWWGEGYIVHTVPPMCTAKWGFTTPVENSAFSCGISLDEHRCISCLVLSEQQIEEDLESELERVLFQMPHVVLQYLQAKIKNEQK